MLKDFPSRVVCRNFSKGGYGQRGGQKLMWGCYTLAEGWGGGGGGGWPCLEPGEEYNCGKPHHLVRVSWREMKLWITTQ